MEILRGVGSLKKFLMTTDCSAGCLADTGFLYGVSDVDDRVYEQAQAIFEILEEKNIPVHTNIIGRVEFVDLVFRKQLTIGAIKLFESMTPHSSHKGLYNFLKKIRDDNTIARRNRQSFKLGETQLKKLRSKLEDLVGVGGWQNFCTKYAGEMLLNEWRILEEELGLYFICFADIETDLPAHKAVLILDNIELSASE